MIAKGVPARRGTRTFATGIAYVQKHEHRRHPELVCVGVSFTDRVSYASAEEKAAWTHTRGVSSVATAAYEMEAVARLSVRCADPVQHEIIAYAKHEHPRREQMVADVENLLGALDLADHQYVMSVHTDTDDLHAHVIVNRVGPDGRANAQWHERIIRERVCAQIAAKRGWNIVVGFHNRDIVQERLGLETMPAEPQRRVFDGNFNRVYERGELPWQDAARPYVFEAVERAMSWDDLRARLDAHGVVLKAVQRGGRFQGLAFAEGLAPDAPGCAASRIDARCKLSALEARFGAYAPPASASQPGPETRAVVTADIAEKPVLWRDQMRSAILTAVDTAQSWDDLRSRLGDASVVLKAVERGVRFQGLAFAGGEGEDAPGCGASRIDDRCKRSALEARFGPFPDVMRPARGDGERDAASDRGEDRADVRTEERANSEMPGFEQEPAAASASATKTSEREDARESVRERVERDSARNAERASARAQGIADNARLRDEYQRFCDRFYQERREGWNARREALWNAESVQRRLESERRWKSKQMQRSAVRLVTPSGGVRRFGYGVVEKLHTLRTNHERNRARARWEGVKAELTYRVGQERADKPARYRDFVAEQAKSGDRGAQRVLSYLDRRGAFTVAVEKAEKTVEHSEQPSRLTVEFAETEKALAERSAAIEQEKRTINVRPEPEPLELQIAKARQAVLAVAREQGMEWTSEEMQRLEDIERKRGHWNPLVRVVAGNEERSLLAKREARVARMLDDAEWAFRQREISKLTSAYDAAFRDRREGKVQLVRLEEEQRGIGRDLRAIEGMRRELEAMEGRSGKGSSHDRERLPEDAHKRFANLRSTFEVERKRFSGRSREEKERENDIGLELER